MANLYIESMTLNILLCIIFEGLSARPVTEQFTAIGEKIQITCPDNQSSSWQKFDTSEILASCESGKATIKTSLLHKINVTDDCQTLTIKDFKIEDVGQYRCFVTNPDAKAPMYDFDIQIRSVTIVEANNSSIMKRNEGENITLTCSIHGAQPDTVIYWTVGGTILRTNQSMFATYKFTAKSYDHMKQFVCIANSSKDINFLKAKVQLSLILKPNVTVVSLPNPPTVRKGHNITLLCQDKSGNDEIINSFLWNHNERMLSTNASTLQIVRAQSNATGKYLCNVKNAAGEDFHIVIVTLIYPPVVQNYNVTFTINDRPIALKCEANGAPNKYKFSEWRHYTHNDQLVRTLQGYTNGTLILPHHEDITFEESGIYICNVTNEVQDEDGHVWKVGKVKVTFEGIPILRKPRKYRYIGYFKETSSVSIFVLSSSNISKADWYDERQMLRNTSTCSSQLADTEFFGKIFNVPAYKCDFVIQTTTKDDFQNYSVIIANQFGKLEFNFSLESANEINSSGTKYIGFVLAFTFTVCILVICWRFRKGKRNDSQRLRANEQQIQVDLNEPPSTSASMSAGRTDVYSSIDRRKENLDKHKVTYKISEPKQRKFQLTDRKGRKGNTEGGSSNLNYIDVVFEPKAHSGNLYIHGADSRTPYADIDFTAKAEPLISSDEDDESFVNEKENCTECLSSEDVQQLNIIED